MKQICLFDMAFMKYTHMHTPYPTTAGIVLAGYHEAQGDRVTLATSPPDFSLFDVVYVIKDDWDLYHDPKWLLAPNAIQVGRFWEDGITVWKTEWEQYPPSLAPYQRWAKGWLEKYKHVNPDRFDHFYYTPFLLKVDGKFQLPTEEKTLLIDYDLANADPHMELLPYIDLTMRTLHPLNITKNPEEKLKFLMQKNMKKMLWATVDFPLKKEDFDELIRLWPILKVPRTVRLKTWVRGYSADHWHDNILEIMSFLKRWRSVGKRVNIEPVDEFLAECPDLLYFIRRWSGKNMGYAMNSLLDYCIHDSFEDKFEILPFLADPLNVVNQKKIWIRGTQTKKVRLLNILDYLHRNLDIAEAASEPVGRRAV